MKKLSFIIATGAIFFCSCGNGGKENKGTDSSAILVNKEAEAVNNQSDTSMAGQKPTVDQKCVDFAVKAGNAGLKEIELGQWAQQYATRQDVKDYGKMMVEDHTKAADELKAIAKTKHIMMPNLVPDGVRSDIDKMKTKNQGKEVDKAFINEMVSDHKDAVDLFSDASKNATDPDLKNFATKTLPALQRHLDAAKALKAKL